MSEGIVLTILIGIIDIHSVLFYPISHSNNLPKISFIIKK